MLIIRIVKSLIVIREVLDRVGQVLIRRGQVSSLLRMMR